MNLKVFKLIKLYLIILILVFKSYSFSQTYERFPDTWNIRFEAPKDSLYIMKFKIVDKWYVYPVKAFYRGSFMSKIVFPNNKSIELRNCFLWFYLKIGSIKIKNNE